MVRRGICSSWMMQWSRTSLCSRTRAAASCARRSSRPRWSSSCWLRWAASQRSMRRISSSPTRIASARRCSSRPCSSTCVHGSDSTRAGGSAAHPHSASDRNTSRNSNARSGTSASAPGTHSLHRSTHHAGGAPRQRNARPDTRCNTSTSMAEKMANASIMAPGEWRRRARRTRPRRRPPSSRWCGTRAPRAPRGDRRGRG